MANPLSLKRPNGSGNSTTKIGGLVSAIGVLIKAYASQIPWLDPIGTFVVTLGGLMVLNGGYDMFSRPK